MKAMTKKRWIAVLTALAVVVAASITTAFVLGGDSEPKENPVLAPAPTDPPTTKKVTTTTAEEPLPQPEPPPKDPYAPTPLVQVGVIEIPKIGLVHKVFEGVTLTVIDKGPGHWPGSAMPGQRGNTVFPGHRVTNTRPFYDLDKLVNGDQIVFHMPTEDVVYKVTSTQIVRPTDMWVIDPTRSPTVTLIACHPKHSAAQRIVVKGIIAAKIPRTNQA
jgi:sortase A